MPLLVKTLKASVFLHEIESKASQSLAKQLIILTIVRANPEEKHRSCPSSSDVKKLNMVTDRYNKKENCWDEQKINQSTQA